MIFRLGKRGRAPTASMNEDKHVLLVTRENAHEMEQREMCSGL